MSKIVITIISKYDMIFDLVEYRVPQSRFMWKAPNLEVYVLGPLNGKLYEQAGAKAMDYAERKGIAPHLVVRHSAEINRNYRFDTKTKGMF